MDRIFLDFETYFDRGYSLTKMTTPEYIMDPRFQMMGVSIAVNDGPVEFYKELPDLNYENSELIAHNCYFDAMILNLRYKRKAKRYSCTLRLAAYWLPTLPSKRLGAVSEFLGLGAKGDALVEGSSAITKELEDYANQDVELCRKIYNMLPIPEAEREVLHITLRWGVEPTLHGNIDKFLEAAKEEEEKRDRLIKASGVSEKVLMSNTQFSAWIQNQGIEIPMKPSPSNGWPTPALAKGDPEFHILIDQNPGLDHVWKARIASKSNINIKRPRTMARLCQLTGGLLPMPLNWCGAHTTRWCIAEGSLLHVLEDGIIKTIEIQNLQPHQLVWDGEEFVKHDGLVYSGQQEVMTYDGVTATKEHNVFTESGKMPISEAHAENHPIKSAGVPDANKINPTN